MQTAEDQEVPLPSSSTKEKTLKVGGSIHNETPHCVSTKLSDAKNMKNNSKNKKGSSTNVFDKPSFSPQFIPSSEEDAVPSETPKLSENPADIDNGYEEEEEEEEEEKDFD